LFISSFISCAVFFISYISYSLLCFTLVFVEVISVHLVVSMSS
jgi:hypothetical protein